MQTLKWNLNLVTPFHFFGYIETLISKHYNSAEDNKLLKELSKEAMQTVKLCLIHYDSLHYRAGELVTAAFNHVITEKLAHSNLDSPRLHRF